MIEDKIRRFLLENLEEVFESVKIAENGSKRIWVAVRLYCDADRARDTYLSFLDELEGVMDSDEVELLRRCYSNASFDLCDWAKYSAGNNTEESHRTGKEILGQIRKNLPRILQILRDYADSQGLDFDIFAEKLTKSED